MAAEKGTCPVEDFIAESLSSAEASLYCGEAFVLCRLEAVQNDQEKKEIGDGRKYNHKGYLSFQAQINK